MRTAIAIFVKTLGHTPLKTRLAADIGEERAHRFYELCVSAIEASVKQQTALGHCRGVWAVAEEQAHNSWHGLPIVAQGDGGLGERLHLVYSQLQATHGACVLMAADSPQISDEIFSALWSALNVADFVLGPATDGGFYLCAGKRSLPAEVWQSISYSQGDTLEQLRMRLRGHGSILELPALDDVDYGPDLGELFNALRAMPKKTPEQHFLELWLEGVIEDITA